MEGLVAADAKDDFLTARLRGFFIGRDADLVPGWNAAAALGPAATPILWRLLDGVATGESRFALLAAIQAAGGVGEDDRFLRWIEAPGRTARDRLFVAFLLASGGDRPAPRPDLLLRLRGANDLADLLGSLAAARFPGVEGLPPAAANADSDLGRAAAALFAGGALREAPPRGTRHEALFWRGALLGAARRRQGEALRERALALRQERGEGFEGVRQAANWLLAGLSDPTVAAARLDDESLAILVGDRAMRARLAPSIESARAARAEPLPVLAVAHALECPLDVAVATREAWATGPGGGAAVLALAFRLLVRAEASTPALPAWSAVPEWAVARAAAGGGESAFPGLADAKLAHAATAFASGRLPPSAFADAIELAVWRAGAHPGAVARRLERDFLRDLVLAGSQEGGGKYQPHVPPAQRYFCPGLGRDEPWFRVAIAFHEWNHVPRGAVPAAVRWPRSR